jgi:hypothetical protein
VLSVEDLDINVGGAWSFILVIIIFYFAIFACGCNFLHILDCKYHQHGFPRIRVLISLVIDIFPTNLGDLLL